MISYMLKVLSIPLKSHLPLIYKDPAFSLLFLFTQNSYSLLVRFFSYVKIAGLVQNRVISIFTEKN